jgi:hypothetical protein
VESQGLGRRGGLSELRIDDRRLGELGLDLAPQLEIGRAHV